MAKSKRASSIKTNNAALKSKVFGPVETARTERLSAKLMELAAQPKPVQVQEISEEVEVEAIIEEVVAAPAKPADAMEVDDDSSKAPKSSRSGKGRIERKKSSRKAAMVFPKYKNGSRVSKVKSKSKK